MEHDPFTSLAVWAGIFFRLTMIMVYGAMAIGYTIFLRWCAGKQQPRGVVVFGVLLIIGSIYKLSGFLNYNYYWFMFQQLPDNIIFIRYLGSVLLRIAGLIIATGVLMLNEKFRKAFIFLCLATLCTLYFKHPFYVFDNISRLTEEMFFHKKIAGELTFPLHPWISLIFNYMVDIIFCGSALFYFTRPKVKEQFS